MSPEAAAKTAAENAITLLVYTLPQAASATSLCERTLRNLITAGELRACFVGNRILIPRQSLEEMLSRRRVSTTKPKRARKAATK
jgi:excisionase family DNA binding protein